VKAYNHCKVSALFHFREGHFCGNLICLVACGMWQAQVLLCNIYVYVHVLCTNIYLYGLTRDFSAIKCCLYLPRAQLLQLNFCCCWCWFTVACTI